MTLHFPQNNYLIKTAETQTNQMKYTLATTKAHRNTDERDQAFRYLGTWQREQLLYWRAQHSQEDEIKKSKDLSGIKLQQSTAQAAHVDDHPTTIYTVHVYSTAKWISGNTNIYNVPEGAKKTHKWKKKQNRTWKWRGWGKIGHWNWKSKTEVC